MQFSQSQRTDGDLFSDDGSLSRDVLQDHLTPGALDAFLAGGMDGGMDPNEAPLAIGGGEEAGMFDIPNVLLVDMPIAEITPNTKILHLGKSNMAKTTEGTHQPNSDTAPTAPTSSQAGPSGLQSRAVEEAMDVEHSTTPATTVAAVTPATSAKIPGQAKQQQVQDAQAGRSITRPKKGTNTKNNKVNPQPAAQAEPQDETLNERMSLLQKITELMKASYGSRRNEMEVWGHYVGLKASRIPEGRKRDKMLVRVEELLNEATYDDVHSDD